MTLCRVWFACELNLGLTAVALVGTLTGDEKRGKPILPYQRWVK